MAPKAETLKWTPLSRPILGEFKVDCVFVFDRHFLSEVEVSGYLIVESLVRSVLVIEEEVVDQSLDQKGDGPFNRTTRFMITATAAR